MMAKLRLSVTAHIKDTGFPVHETFLLSLANDPKKTGNIKATLFVPRRVLGDAAECAWTTRYPCRLLDELMLLDMNYSKKH